MLSVGHGDAEPSAQAAGGCLWDRVHPNTGLSERHSESISVLKQGQGLRFKASCVKWINLQQKVLAWECQNLGSHASNGALDS